VRRAFTLIEVLVVVAILAILAALLLPALSGAKARSKRVACLNHLRQLWLCSQMYAADNGGKLAENRPRAPGGSTTNAWVLGDLQLPAEATNLFWLRQGQFFPYASQPAIYRCPADSSQTAGVPRVRSYSMNGWIGGRSMETDFFQGQKGYRTFVKDTEIAAAGPSRLWLMIDEHEVTIDDGFFPVLMDDSAYSWSLPATRHQNGYSLSFADGHTELFKLRGAAVKPQEVSPGRYTLLNSFDWDALKQVTTTR
jgi:prepilin-type N-terminal cleavage/methylation domain-containing protein/prepilin-type processing-associated H-X9-DG protein